MLELRGVDFAYGPVAAVRNVDLQIDEGTSTALLGRNGAGKSTVLKLLAGVVRPDTGAVLWDGTPIQDEPSDRRIRRGIALVPEGRALFPALSVEENLRVGAYPHRPDRARLQELLGEVYSALPPIADRRTQLAGTLSGGEQQMVAIGRALMSEPRVLLLDEPSLGLAPLVIETLYAFLERLMTGPLAIVLVEQYVDFALQLCDRTAVLDKGRIVVAGPSGELAGDARIADIYLGSSSRSSADVKV